MAKDDGDGIRKVMISGTKSQVQKCKALIKEKTGKKLQSAKKHSAKRRKAEGATKTQKQKQTPFSVAQVTSICTKTVFGCDFLAPDEIFTDNPPHTHTHPRARACAHTSTHCYSLC